MYTVQYLGNVMGGYPVRYLNLPMDVIKRAASQSVAEGEAVWFGADVGKQWARDEGILDAELYDYDLVVGDMGDLDKAARLDYGESRMNHAMVFTGVDLDDNGAPLKWRVENSGGTEQGDKGFLTMSDSWFSEYLYEIVVHKRYLDDAALQALELEPIVLPPWDPMGALA
jgi:bleomycin hydrolase